MGITTDGFLEFHQNCEARALSTRLVRAIFNILQTRRLTEIS